MYHTIQGNPIRLKKYKIEIKCDNRSEKRTTPNLIEIIESEIKKHKFPFIRNQLYLKTK